MKSCILTFQDVLNYGAALQAYALKTYISKYKECEIINYHNEFFHKPYKFGKNTIFDIIYCRSRNKKRNRYKKFQNEKLELGGKISKQNLCLLNDKYDYFIAGSDQVWNLECSGNDKSYFLDFVSDNKKKYSYAASFGSAEANVSDVYNLIKDYNRISVREKSGKNSLMKLSTEEIAVVLDPTFLLTKEQWYKEFKLEDKEEYILIYEVLNGFEIENYAKRLAKETGLEIICITSSNRIKKGMKTVRNAGPEEWLRYFSKAKYILTNSFHGTVFSIIFEKNFCVELLPPPATTNTRMIELLSMFELENRIISNGKYNADKISYDKVRDILDNERNKSYSYIMDIFG